MSNSKTRRATIDYFLNLYYEAGFSLIPLRARSKSPRARWKSAQTERAGPTQFSSWLASYSNMGIGIVTGTISNLVVIDVDGEDADAAILQLLTPTAVVKTRRGQHYYYRLPYATVIPSKIGFAKKIDVKAEGGYVVAPPSLNEENWEYAWAKPLSNIVQIPDALLERIMATSSPLESYQELGGTKWRINLAGTSEGENGGRNNSAAAIIGKLLETTPPELWEFCWMALQEWNQQNKPPLELPELRRTFDSIKHKETIKRRAKAVLESEHLDDSAAVEHFADKEFEKPTFAIANMLVAGCSMIVGKPKRGKTVLTMQMALAVATGKNLFDNDLGLIGGKRFPVEQGSVKYLALEDNQARFLRRLRDLNGGALPKNFEFATKHPGLHRGGLEKLHDWVDRTENPKLIVIDSLAAFTGQDQQTKNMGNAFKTDYNIMLPIFEFSQERKIAVLIINHARKTQGKWNEQDDPMDAVSGTLGGAAAVDTYLFLDRALDSELAQLSVVGRDVSAYRIALHQPRPPDPNNAPMSRFSLGDMEAFLEERRGATIAKRKRK